MFVYHLQDLNLITSPRGKEMDSGGGKGEGEGEGGRKEGRERVGTEGGRHTPGSISYLLT